jgi:hypothetical protein
MNFENPSPAVPVFALRNGFRAVSARDYRRKPLPSPFGPETGEFREEEHARAWLRALSYGGHLERWDEMAKKWVFVENIEPAKEVTR